MEYDTIIVGGGVMGMAAAWYSAVHRGRCVLLLEQFPLFHQRGSSHGHGRNFRSTYNDRHQNQFMCEAYELWRQVECEAGLPHQLLISCGNVNLAGAAATHANTRNLEDSRVPFEVLSRDQMERKFPFMNFSGCDDGGAGTEPPPNEYIYEERGGVLAADLCNRTFYELARGAGAQFRDKCRVTDIVRADGETTENTRLVVHVVSNHNATTTSPPEIETYQTKAVIIASGSWSKCSPVTRSLIEAYRLPVKILRAGYCYYAAKPDAKHAVARYPSYQNKDERFRSYGGPALEFANTFKVGYHSDYHDVRAVAVGGGGGTDEVDPQMPMHTPLSAHNIQANNEYVARFYPELDPRPIAQIECMYTSLPDNRFVLDHVELPGTGSAPVVLAMGFCGSGFKLAPIIGKLASLLSEQHAESASPPQETSPATTTRSIPGIDYDLSVFRANRFLAV